MAGDIDAQVAEFAEGVKTMTPADLVQSVAVFSVKRNAMKETNENRLAEAMDLKERYGQACARARQSKTYSTEKAYFERRIRSLEKQGLIPAEAIELTDRCLKAAGQELNRRFGELS